MMITLADYYMGRDHSHRAELTPEIDRNARHLLDRVNLLLSYAAKDGVHPGTDATTDTPVASGWRPRAINDRTANAASGSKHKTGNGIDVRDTAARDLARWCMKNLDLLEELGLYMEDPQWTPSWCHFQDLPPGSGRRVYVPSNAPPLVAKLPEQLQSSQVA